jgi:hypothetical protein
VDEPGRVFLGELLAREGASLPSWLIAVAAAASYQGAASLPGQGRFDPPSLEPISQPPVAQPPLAEHGREHRRHRQKQHCGYFHLTFYLKPHNNEN